MLSKLDLNYITINVYVLINKLVKNSNFEIITLVDYIRMSWSIIEMISVKNKIIRTIPGLLNVRIINVK